MLHGFEDAFLSPFESLMQHVKDHAFFSSICLKGLEPVPDVIHTAGLRGFQAMDVSVQKPFKQQDDCLGR